MKPNETELVFPWRGGLNDAFKKFMLSKGVQTALQLATGDCMVPRIL